MLQMVFLMYLILNSSSCKTVLQDYKKSKNSLQLFTK